MSVDVLLTEVDRQLSEQRSQADAFATRSGMMIAATALLTGFLARSAPGAEQSPSPVLWVIAGAAAVGILVLCMSRLIMGPTPSQLGQWSHGFEKDELLKSKIIAVEANSRVLVRSEVIFMIQAIATVAGIALMVSALFMENK